MSAFNNLTLSREATEILLKAVHRRELVVWNAMDRFPTESRWEKESEILGSLHDALKYICDRYEEV
jgi:hypothetical protein